MSRKLRFIIEPNSVTPLEFLRFMNQTPIKLDFDSEQGIVVAEITAENTSEINQLICELSKICTIKMYTSTSDTSTDIPIEPSAKINTSKDATVNDNNSENSSERLFTSFSFLNDDTISAIDKLRKTIFWAVKKQNVDEAEISNQFIWPLIKEMSLLYSKDNNRDCDIGDIVTYFNNANPVDSTHIGKTGIICNKIDNMIYLLPISIISKEFPNSNTPVLSKGDISFNDSSLETKPYRIFFTYGRYLSARRVSEIIGKVSDTFMEKVFDELQKTFDFRKKIQTTNNTAVVEEEPKASQMSKQDILLKFFNSSFENLSESKNIKQFLKELSIEDELLQMACIQCCKLEKITVNAVLTKLSDLTGKSHNFINASLKNGYEKWLDAHPYLKEKCNTISFISLIKAIKKSINK